MPSEVQGAIQLEQTLHGYDEGHRLLASSVRLPRVAEHELLIASDLSGPAVVAGFESYLTGYLLPEASYYVFARTWYAAEMRRPGCVWTHSLLIPLADLARIMNLHGLIPLFRRPTTADGASGFGEYQRSVSHIDDHKALGIVDSERFRKVVLSIYGSPTVSIGWARQSASDAEEAIIGIWNQQWPRLRRTFRFSTGSISDRNTDEYRFDFQIIPKNTSHRPERGGQARMIMVEEQDPSVAKGPWVDTLLADLRAPNSFGLRDFLRLAAADAAQPRAAMAPLCSLYAVLIEGIVSERKLENVLSLTAQVFPSQEEGNALKNSLFGGNSMLKRLGSPIASDDAEFVLQLLKSPSIGSLSPTALELPERVQTAWKRDHDFRRDLLAFFRDASEPQRQLISTAVAETINAESAGPVLAEMPDALPVLLAIRKELIYEVEFWRTLPAEVAPKAISILSSDGMAIDLDQLAAAIMQNHTASMASTIVQALGSRFVEEAFRLLSSSESLMAQLADSWWEALTSETSVVLGQLSKEHGARADLLFLNIASRLDPNRVLVSGQSLGLWITHLEPFASRASDRDKATKALSFLLILGLRSTDVRAAGAIAASFEAVHEAICRNALATKSWEQLSPHLAEPQFGREWDKAARLRHTVIARFLRGDWDVSLLLRALSRPETFRVTFSECGDSRERREFRDAVFTWVRAGKPGSTAALRDTVSQMSRKKKRRFF